MAEARQYALFGPEEGLLEPYRRGDVGGVRDYFVWRLREQGFPGLAEKGAFAVVALPSLAWKFSEGTSASPEQATAERIAEPPEPERLAVAFAFRDTEIRARFADFLRAWRKEEEPEIGADLPFQLTDHWRPGEALDPIFGSRADAGRLLGLDRLYDDGAAGQGVNVVIVDQGVDKALIPRSNFGGGWTNGGDPPGATKAGHGAMVVRNVRQAAPEATIFDCRLIPPAIDEIGAFLSDAQAVFETMLADIRSNRASGRWRGPWVFVNAWGIYSRASEHPPGDYTDRPSHPFNRLMARLSRCGFDAVFAAGNCGQFCPNRRCGPNDRGPGRSIFGANSHPEVLTVGAVRTDAMWLGYSSQGPGQPHLTRRKPDLCAPSQFRENEDAHLLNTGTSAACGLAAGVVAALRGRWGPGILPPDELRELLRRTARALQGPACDARLGSGILDAAAAFEGAAALSS